jgi:uncharacterized protein (TIGR02391 family)
MAQDPLPSAAIESLSRLLGDYGSGSEIDMALKSCGIEFRSSEGAKWRRLNETFIHLQSSTRSAATVLQVIRQILAAEKYVQNVDLFEERRSSVNMVLLLHGVEYRANGKFYKCEPAQTLDQAESRLRKVQKMLRERAIHPEVTKYCRAELMQDNYFHAVFEACKGLAQRVREMANIEIDGAELVDKVFLGPKPILALNTLRTESELSEQRGLGNLMKGCFSALRNPRAHTPKVLCKDEGDTADLLTLVSLLHRKLDICQPTGYRP